MNKRNNLKALYRRSYRLKLLISAAILAKDDQARMRYELERQSVLDQIDKLEGPQ